MAFGQLDHGGAAQPVHEINVTPLVDVMLVLLVVFIITAPLLTHHIKLDLPQQSAQPVVAQAATVVSITAESGVYLDDQLVDEVQLAQRLQALTAGQPPNVELRADAKVAYERVIQVLSVVQAAGISKLAFMTQPSPSR
jgi:biopolymer transport protein ExbD